MTRSRDTASIIPTVDAKGDLLVGTADNTIDNLSPGTNGQVLTVNSATATGLEWGNNVISSATPPTNTSAIWFNTENGTAYVYYDGFWTSVAGSSGTPIISDTAPTSPVVGMQWFNSSNGKSYLYYSDAWVEVDSNGNSASSNGNSVINGGFDIWQRGTSFTASGTAYLYGADRWNIFSSGSGRTYSRQLTGDTTNLPDIQYCIRAAKNSGDTNNSVVRFWTDLESVNSIPLAGKTVTFSFYARRGAGYSASGNGLAIQLISGTGTDQNWGHVGYTGSTTVINQTATLTTTWQRFTYTATLASNISQVGVNFAFTPVGTAGANDYFEVTGVQLEAGTVATPFRRNAPSIQAELAACQRSYFRTANAGLFAAHGLGQCFSTTGALIFLRNPVQLRSAPSSIEFSSLRLDDSVGGVAISNLALQQSISTSIQTCVEATASGLAQFRAVSLSNNNNTAGFVAVSAEL